MTIKVTQRMLDYINGHKEKNEDGILYNQDFEVELEETCEIGFVYQDGMLVLRREKFGDSFCIPADVAGVDYDDLQIKLMQKRYHDDYIKSVDWQDVRIKASMAVLQGMCSNDGVWKQTTERLVGLSVEIADKLVEELKKDKEMPTIRQKV